MQEIFVPVKGFEIYHVSNHGRIRRAIGGYERNDGFQRPCLDKDGYHQVTFSVKGIQYKRRLHRVVAQAFIPNPNNYPVVNHLDFNRTNNHVSNLEWCTPAQNTAHSRAAGRLGSRTYYEGREHYGYRGDVKCFTKDGDLVATYEGLREAAQAVNGDPSNISSVILGRARTSYGFVWKREEA